MDYTFAVGGSTLWATSAVFILGFFRQFSPVLGSITKWVWRQSL